LIDNTPSANCTPPVKVPIGAFNGWLDWHLQFLEFVWFRTNICKIVTLWCTEQQCIFKRFHDANKRTI